MWQQLRTEWEYACIELDGTTVLAIKYDLQTMEGMRGETLEEFQRTRNAPGALYSVAGKEAGNLAWDQGTGVERRG